MFVTVFNLPKSGQLTSAVMYFTLDSEVNEDPPEFTLTCQSKGGPATEVVWMKNGVRVEEDSSHITSQIIVDTSGNTVYNNTLRVRGREGGQYECIINNNRSNSVGVKGEKILQGMLNNTSEPLKLGFFFNSCH